MNPLTQFKKIRVEMKSLALEAIMKSKPGIGLTRHFIGGVLCLAAISLICARAPAQNLFAVDVDPTGGFNGSIDEFTPNGVRSIFASGLTSPFALAFDSGGNLFVADGGDPYDYPPVPGGVYKFTPTGLRSTIFSDMSGGLAIDSADNLFVGLPGSILKISPSGVRTTFASRSVGAMAFQRNLAPNPAPYDFNSDGHPDYLLFNPNTRQMAIWYLNNNTLIGHSFGPTASAGWSVVAP